MNRIIGVTLLIFATLRASGQAQVREANDPSLQAACQANVATVGQGSQDPRYVEALEGLRACGISGPPIFASLWSNATTDPTLLGALVGGSLMLRDSRILNALILVAQSTSPTAIRLSALQVLTSYADTFTVPSMGELNAPHIGNILPSNDHVGLEEPSSPLTLSAGASIGALFRDLALQDPDPLVKSAALYLRQGMSYRKPQITPIAASALDLAFLCNKRFRLRNGENIGFRITYAVQNTTESRFIDLRAPASGQAYSEVIVDTKNTGPVDIFYNGQVVASHPGTDPGCIPPPTAHTVYLHGTAGGGQPLFLDLMPSSSSTAKNQASPALQFSGGNPWKDVGTWAGPAPLVQGQLTSLGNAHLWVGLKNSDDQGTRFDLRVEVSRDNFLVAAGETYCIQGVTNNPNNAVEVSPVFGSFAPVAFDAVSNVLSLKVRARVGTNGSGSFCGGHSNAVGLRVYFDSTTRPAKFDATF